MIHILYKQFFTYKKKTVLQNENVSLIGSLGSVFWIYANETGENVEFKCDQMDLSKHSNTSLLTHTNTQT